MISIAEGVISRSQDSDWPLLAVAFVFTVGIVTIALWLIRFVGYVAETLPPT